MTPDNDPLLRAIGNPQASEPNPIRDASILARCRAKLFVARDRSASLPEVAMIFIPCLYLSTLLRQTAYLCGFV